MYTFPIRAYSSPSREITMPLGIIINQKYGRHHESVMWVIMVDWLRARPSIVSLTVTERLVISMITGIRYPLSVKFQPESYVSKL